MRRVISSVPRPTSKPDSPADTTAARELEEEVGQRAGRIEKLGWVWTTPGFCDEKIHLYAAFDLTPAPLGHNEDEVIEIVPTPIEDALDLVWRGELTDAKSAMALVHAARHIGLLG